MHSPKSLEAVSMRAKSIASTMQKWLPSRGNMIFTLVIVFALFWAQSAGAFNNGKGLAAEPTGSTSLIAYQGRLADNLGNPLTGTYTMVFRLYSQDTGGVPLWEEQWTGPNSVAISDGLFNVMLGSLTPIPQAIVTGNTTLFLGITVDSDDEMAPRVQVGSVLYARQALTVPDGTVNTTKIADSAVTGAKISDGTITGADIADSAINSAKISDGAIVSSDIANGSITSEDIMDGTIATTDIANGAITKAKLGADVNNTFIQGGRLEVTEYTPGYGLHTGSGERYYVAWVPFNQSFASTPTVLVSLSKFNLLGTKNTCLDVYPQNISAGGFELVYHTWWDCTVYLTAATWVAYGTK